MEDDDRMDASSDDSSSEGSDTASSASSRRGDDGNDGDNNEEEGEILFEADIGHRFRWAGRYKEESGGKNDQDQKEWQVGEDERKKHEEDFLLFTKILTKSVKDETGDDSKLHAQIKAIKEVCKTKNEQFQLGYEYLTTSMRVALKQLILKEKGHSSALNYWNSAETDLQKTLEERNKKQKEEQEEDAEEEGRPVFARPVVLGGVAVAGGRNEQTFPFSLKCL